MSEASGSPAGETLHKMVAEAADKLRRLGPEPVVIACAPDKFNDSRHDDFWCAVQIGGAYWEQSQFFRSTIPGKGHCKEAASFGVDSTESGDGVGTSLLISQRILAARALLNGLESCGWRELAAEALRRDVITGLIIQFDQTWLWIGDPQGLSSIYIVHPNGIAHFADEEGRLDGRIGDPDHIQPWRFNQGSFGLLSARARQQFLPQLVDEAASEKLYDALSEATAQVRRITDLAVLIKLADASSRRHQYRSFRYDSPYGLGVTVDRVVFNKPQFDQQLRQYEQFPDMRAKHLERFSFVDFAALWNVGDQLRLKECRRLFESALGVDTFDSEDLHLLVVGELFLLIHRTSVFRFDRNGRLTLGAFLKRPVFLNSRQQELEQIAAFDPALVDRLHR